MLPAQIPLTLEHLFPTPSNSNVRDRFGGPFYIPVYIPDRHPARTCTVPSSAASPASAPSSETGSGSPSPYQ